MKDSEKLSLSPSMIENISVRASGLKWQIKTLKTVLAFSVSSLVILLVLTQVITEETGPYSSPASDIITGGIAGSASGSEQPEDIKTRLLKAMQDQERVKSIYSDYSITDQSIENAELESITLDSSYRQVNRQAYGHATSREICRNSEPRYCERDALSIYSNTREFTVLKTQTQNQRTVYINISNGNLLIPSDTPVIKTTPDSLQYSLAANSLEINEDQTLALLLSVKNQTTQSATTTPLLDLSDALQYTKEPLAADATFDPATGYLSWPTVEVPPQQSSTYRVELPARAGVSHINANPSNPNSYDHNISLVFGNAAQQVKVSDTAANKFIKSARRIPFVGSIASAICTVVLGIMLVTSRLKLKNLQQLKRSVNQ